MKQSLPKIINKVPLTKKIHICDVEIGTGIARRFLSLQVEMPLTEEEKQEYVEKILMKYHKKATKDKWNLFESYFY